MVTAAESPRPDSQSGAPRDHLSRVPPVEADLYFQQSLAHVDARPRGRRGWETDVRETRGVYASVNLNTKVQG